MPIRKGAKCCEKKNGTARKQGGETAAPWVEWKKFMHSECKIRAKKQGVLEADGDMDVESLPLALRRYQAFVQNC